MPTTSVNALPYPATDDDPDVPSDIKALADRLETLLNTIQTGTGVLAIPLNTGANWSGATAKYQVKNGRCFLEGSAIRSTGTTTTVGTLPSGARPAQAVNYSVRVGTTTSNFAIGTDGVMSCTSGYTNGSDLYFDGISFRVA